mgnify:CR=1 FL=1
MCILKLIFFLKKKDNNNNNNTAYKGSLVFILFVWFDFSS